MSAHPSRIWESANEASAQSNLSAKPTQLPSIATLTNPPSGTNPSSPSTFASGNRTSDPWNSNPQSTRSSAYSSGLNGYPSSFTSPHRASNSSQLGATSYPTEYQNGHSPANHQQSPGFGPPQHSLGLPAINQHHQDPLQLRDSHEFPSQGSRRSSISSQVNKGFGNLQINGVASPYINSPAPSQSSIAVSLQRERGIPHQTNGVRTSGTSSVHQPMSPLGPFPGESRQAFSTRTAPIISANPIKEVYNAENPTAGQPYAFPDPDMSNRSSGSVEGHGSNMVSRRNSGHTSITSSVATHDSKLPMGQHRLDEDIPDMPGTHHHSLQHKAVSNLSQDGDSPDPTSPYSRTPALRASHKLAERKRRTEMKQLFDQLRAQIPASHGSKSSKWEILSKASEHIKSLENEAHARREAQVQLRNLSVQVEELRREMETLRSENYHLSQEMQHYREQGRPQTATAMHPQPPQFSNPNVMMTDRSLPPLTNGIQASSSMQGVQYTEERR